MHEHAINQHHLAEAQSEARFLLRLHNTTSKYTDSKLCSISSKKQTQEDKWPNATVNWLYILHIQWLLPPEIISALVSKHKNSMNLWKTATQMNKNEKI